MSGQRAPSGHFVDLGLFRPGRWPPRPVRAWVPAGDDSPRPLLILFDGQNVFGDEGSFTGGWHAHEAAASIRQKTVHKPIIVGVGNGGLARIDEMGRGGRRFADAVVADVLSRVLARFPVLGPCDRVVGGASLGGLTALQLLLDHPDAVGGALAMSPSLWFADQALLRSIEAGRSPISYARVYLDVGLRESGQMVRGAQRLASILTSRGFGPDRLLWRPDPRGAHHERHWRRRLPKALRFLFRRR